MAYYINDECILCDNCLPECPENAITPGDPKYIINPELCNDCGNCAEVCPVEACIPGTDVE
ncbi:MAG: ferredoxin [candidate division Zixibacteria bacterium 4484_95]|nr:MAG: ferredoxin [candidate division Zixibacteria bacterium 4484_95]